MSEQAPTVPLSRKRALIRYCVPSKHPKDFDTTRIRPITYIGFMETGKTTAEHNLMNIVAEHLKKLHGQVSVFSVACKSILDFLLWLEVEGRDALRGVDYLNLFVDDVIMRAHSQSGGLKQKSEQVYANIRHELMNRKLKIGVLRISFATQRWRLAPPFFRNSPCLLFKSLVEHDEHEVDRILRIIGGDLLRFLTYNTTRMFACWDDQSKRYAVIKVMYHRGIVDTGSPMKPPEPFVEIPFQYAPDVHNTVTDQPVVKPFIKALTLLKERGVEIRISKQEEDEFYLRARIPPSTADYGIGYVPKDVLQALVERGIVIVEPRFRDALYPKAITPILVKR